MQKIAIEIVIEMPFGIWTLAEPKEACIRWDCMVDIQSGTAEITRGKKRRNGTKILECGPLPNVMGALCSTPQFG